MSETVIQDDYDGESVLDVPVHRHGGDMWFYDDFPCMGPAFNELSEQDKEMVKWAVDRRNMASWWQMESPTASQELSDVAGINAPVNYNAALRRFYPLLTRVAFSLGTIKKSVCIGTYRLKFEIVYLDDGPIVKFEPHELVIDNNRGDEHRRMYMFVTSPIIMTFPFECPMQIIPDFESEILNSILLPLRDDQKLDFLWRMGKSLTDPVESPSVIIFWGPTGEEGKSVLALNISRIFGTGAKWTVTDLIGKPSKWPDSDTVMELAEKRLIICDECDIEDDMNYNNIKRWTSNAPIQSKGVSAYLSQTIIGITNKLGFSKSGSINNSIGRRVIVYRMDKRLGKLKPFPKDAITNRVRLQFISMALSVSNCYERAPVSLEMALETEFKKSVNHVTAGIIIDPNATSSDCRALRYKLTHTGRQYVAKNWGKEVIDLETLKSVPGGDGDAPGDDAALAGAPVHGPNIGYKIYANRGPVTTSYGITISYGIMIQLVVGFTAAESLAPGVVPGDLEHVDILAHPHRVEDEVVDPRAHPVVHGRDPQEQTHRAGVVHGDRVERRLRPAVVARVAGQEPARDPLSVYVVDHLVRYQEHHVVPDGTLDRPPPGVHLLVVDGLGHLGVRPAHLHLHLGLRHRLDDHHPGEEPDLEDALPHPRVPDQVLQLVDVVADQHHPVPLLDHRLDPIRHQHELPDRVQELVPDGGVVDYAERVHEGRRVDGGGEPQDPLSIPYIEKASSARGFMLLVMFVNTSVWLIMWRMFSACGNLV
ncbi:cell division control 48 variant 1 [Fusarium albosuccineum]|uniref:Cell division control 48 variant 1 n=1 Tax=Fusarium albosuccineum TaxID=1237068 RepID=A0A8H4L2V0_9HYPO|nr:cell division control 48 variant 1 [Fusarium albosuccineum]